MKMKPAAFANAGGDVSSDSVEVLLERDDQRRERRTFANSPAGHKALITWCRKHARLVRICVEATGIYSLDLALALHKAIGIEVMVANPRATADFGKALLQRSKTDALDAEVILEFAKRMPFVRWDPPSKLRLNLRAIMRRVSALKLMAQQEANRQHAAGRAVELTSLVRKDIEAHLRQMERRIEHLESEAWDLLQQEPDLVRALKHLVSVRGIARTSALHLLGELVALPADMSGRQWVAHAGLDPRHHDSGTSVHKPARISRAGNKYLRSALFFPAMVASRYEPNVRAFYEKLQKRGKTKMQALIAVMRKLLLAIHGMLRTDSDFLGEKFFVLSA